MSSKKPPKFVIATTGRSGSAYIARLLQECDIDCGHEDYFRRRGLRPVGGLDGDASLYAVHRLNAYTTMVGGTVLHQVRHPMHVLSSLVYTFREREDYDIPSYIMEVRYNQMPYPPTGDWLLDFMGLILDMNRRIEQYTDKRYKVEDVDLQQIGEWIGFPITEGEAIRAKRIVSDRYNTHRKGTDFALTVDDLPTNTPERKLRTNQFTEMISRYGY